MALREPFNSVSHIVGGALAIAVAPFLVAAAHGAQAVTGVAVYVTTLVALFAVSAVYHGITHKTGEKWMLRLDHGAIYLLIAGTYTPVALVLYGPHIGLILVFLQWTAAVVGLVTTLTIARKPKWIDQVAYLVLGWMAVAIPGPLAAVGWTGIAWLLAGGFLYSFGAALYGRNRDRRVFGDHEIWHLLVMAGAACHMVFVRFYVLAI